jgi:hypothetical protein
MPQNQFVREGVGATGTHTRRPTSGPVTMDPDDLIRHLMESPTMRGPIVTLLVGCLITISSLGAFAFAAVQR